MKLRYLSIVWILVIAIITATLKISSTIFTTYILPILKEYYTRELGLCLFFASIISFPIIIIITNIYNNRHNVNNDITSHKQKDFLNNTDDTFSAENEDEISDDKDIERPTNNSATVQDESVYIISVPAHITIDWIGDETNKSLCNTTGDGENDSVNNHIAFKIIKN